MTGKPFVLPGILALFLVLAGLAPAGVTAKMKEETPIQRLVRASDTGTDEAFRRLLGSEKQREDFQAPALLRKILASGEIVRMQFGQGYAHEDGKATLVWWSGEIAFRGRAADVGRRLSETLESAGFADGGGRESDEKTWSVTRGGALQEVRIRGPHDFVGGKEPACGFEMYWKVRDEVTSPAPTLKALLKEMPVLGDSRIEGSVVEALASETVGSLAVGGTWTRYYDWDATLASAAGAETALHGKLEKLLTDLGYRPEKKEDDCVTWEREKTGSYAYLSPPDRDHRVRLRFQPES